MNTEITQAIQSMVDTIGNQDPPQSIEAIESQHAGKRLYRTRKERYQDQWQTSPITQPKYEIIPRVEFTYEIMRLALHFTCKTKLQSVSKSFYINPENAKRLTKIIKSITGDITGEYNTSKGIFMYGPPSSGKTFIMQQICHTITRAYYTGWYHLDSPAIFYNYKDITMKARELKSIDFLRTYFDKKDIIFLDDLGYNQENQLNLYGNKEDIVSHLVEILYRRYTDHGAMVYITSNLSLPFIQTTFGAHTHDRIVDMCTPVSWMGDNFRTV